jgi:dTDP-D-glucose 4,6-dehydratase
VILQIKYIDGPIGVDIRTSNNKLIKEKLGWAPHMALRVGIEETYKWIASQMSVSKRSFDR